MIENTQTESRLVGMKTALNELFPDPTTAPSYRAFCEWKAKGYFSTIKIGRRVFCDVDRIRKELEQRFTIRASNN